MSKSASRLQGQVRGWMAPARWRPDVPRNVLVLGLVSGLADISSEVVYPLLPLFLTTVLGAPVAVVGLIEGVAESTASLLKVGAGWWSDRRGRRIPLVMWGYGLAAVGKALLALAPVWPLVLLARVVDRVGKGIRGSPRDALIADSTDPAHRGCAFGLHRAMDTAGAVLGPLLALLLVALLDDRLRLVFLLAVVPGVLSVLALTLVREPRPSTMMTTHPAVRPSLRGVDRQFVLFLLAALIFALGNSSDVFLLLRAKDLGLSTTAVVLAYVLYKFVAMSAAVPGGSAVDRLGRRTVFVAGLCVFALVYAGFALATRMWQAWPLFALYGVFLALTDGVGRALVVELAPSARRATALGAYGTTTGGAALVASIIAGVLWDHVGPAAPFILGAGCAVVAAAVLAAMLPARRITG